MKRINLNNLIPYIVVILILLIIFNITILRVYDAETHEPLPFVTVGAFYTNKEGEVRFLSTAFQTEAALTRIGYHNETAYLGFGLFLRRKEANMTKANYDEILTQVNKWAESLASYQYSFISEVSENGKTSEFEFDAIRQNNDFQFESKYLAASENTLKVISLGGELYKSLNGEPLKGPLTGEEKELFISKNIIFIPLSNLFSSSFPGGTPIEINLRGNLIEFKWEHSSVVIKIQEDGNIGKVDFSEQDGKKNFKATLDIKVRDIPVITIDESK